MTENGMSQPWVDSTAWPGRGCVSPPLWMEIKAPPPAFATGGTLVERERLLKGNGDIWPSAGNFFRRSWFSIMDTAPSETVARCRFWDRPASEQKPGADPDATVGLLLSRDTSGIYYVENVTRMFCTPGKVTEAMVRLAHADGVETTVGFHIDPASAGKLEAAYTIKALDGFDVRYLPCTGDKQVRAKPVSAPAEGGRIKIVKADWNGAFLAELEDFPQAAHDDQVDSLAGAHQSISNRGGPFEFESIRRPGDGLRGIEAALGGRERWASRGLSW